MIRTTVALGATVVAVVAATLLGVWYSRGRVSTLEDFVSAPETAGLTPLTASLVASAIGTWVLFSPAEATATFGGVTALLGYAVGLGLTLAVFAVVGIRIRRLVPHGHSVTEYVLARYGRVMYVLVLAVSATYMFVFLAVELTGIAAALAIVADVSPAVTAGLIGLFVFVYTGYGGLLASLFTDTLQTLVILPLLVLGFVGVLWQLGGLEAIYGRVVATRPALLSLTNSRGLRFGLYVGLALLGANVLNQGLWQRLYAADGLRTVRSAFGIAAVAVLPIVFLSGLFGMIAVGIGVLTHGGHAAFFRVLLATEPNWLVLLVTVVAVLLVMTSADTLLSGIASLALHDLPRVLRRVESDPEEHSADALLAARLLTGVVALAATVIGALQFSEIRLFLTVDLLSTATFVPVVVGLYTGEIPEWGAVAAAASGFLLALGADPVLRPLWRALFPRQLVTALPPPSFPLSFVTAFGVALALTASTALVSDEHTDLNRLDDRVRRLEDGPRDEG